MDNNNNGIYLYPIEDLRKKKYIETLAKQKSSELTNGLKNWRGW